MRHGPTQLSGIALQNSVLIAISRCFRCASFFAVACIFDRGVAGMNQEQCAGSRQPLFRIIHDPPTDRFFLEEITRQAELRSAKCSSTSGPFPWEQVTLPPHTRRSNRPCSPKTAAIDSSAQQPGQQSPTKKFRSPIKVGALKLPGDLAGRLQSVHEDSQTAIRWNGEPVHVKVSGIAAFEQTSKNSPCNTDDLDPIIVPSKAQIESMEDGNGQWLAHIYELKQLARIRPNADGFRNVNIDCTFTPMAYLSESESEPEEVEEDDEEDSSSDENLPVFNRGDRVKFRLSGSLEDRTGRVVSRIHFSVFYDIQSHEGFVFKSVFAGNMKLLPPRERVPKPKPRHVYVKHEKVLWLPPQGEDPMYNSEESSDSDSNDDEAANFKPRATTYKVRIVRLRSFERFDLLLRTGHVIKRVPYDQLRPRAGFSVSSS